MFQMMNEARIAVGIGATATASAAYYAALEYTRERKQGRPLNSKDPAQPQIPIIEHPDVKRMLLYQKAVVEGALGLLLQGAKYSDLEHVVEGEEKERLADLLGLLVPIFKGYPTEKCVDSTSNALQCLGGYGYCDDFPIEQMWRDVRIHPLHEGTTAIQAQDLLGRKVRYNDGRAFNVFCEEVTKTISDAKKYPELVPYADKLKEAMASLKTVTGYLMDQAKSQPKDIWLSDATLYLEVFGTIAVAWQWLNQGAAIMEGLGRKKGKKDRNFYTGKLKALQFFFEYELNNIEGLNSRLLNNDGLTTQMQSDCF
jgi:butyryl-CoA dehydrogenase